jgi:hypothetical protein
MAATVVDELIIVLGLDPSKFTEGQKAAVAALKNTEEEAEKFGKGIEASGKKMEAFFTKLKSEAVAAIGIYFGGREARQIFDYLVNTDATVGRLSSTMKASTETLSTWGGLMERLGGNASDATSAFQGLSSDVNNFLIGASDKIQGQGLFTMLGIDVIHNKPEDVFLQLADNIHKVGDSGRQMAALMSSIPGMTFTMAFAIMKGREEVTKLLEETRKNVAVTKDNSAAAQAYQASLKALGQSVNNAGRQLMQYMYTPLKLIMDKLHDLIEASPAAAAAIGLIGGAAASVFALPAIKWLFGGGAAGAVRAGGSKVVGAAGGILGSTIGRLLLGPLGALLGMTTEAGGAEGETSLTHAGIQPGIPPSVGRPTQGDPRGLIPFIREQAVANGINPDQAVRVAQSEGLSSFLSGIPGELSYGAFQLHVGGGLGDTFRQQTGLDPSDPKNEKAAIAWALKWAASHGWSAWHGWKGSPYAGIGGVRTGAPGAAATSSSSSVKGGDTTTSTNTTTIGNVNVHTSATDGEGIARDIGPALQRQSFAAQANYALQG